MQERIFDVIGSYATSTISAVGSVISSVSDRIRAEWEQPWPWNRPAQQADSLNGLALADEEDNSAEKVYTLRPSAAVLGLVGNLTDADTDVSGALARADAAFASFAGAGVRENRRMPGLTESNDLSEGRVLKK